MIANYKEIDVKGLPDNVFKILDNDWMLITAGTSSSFNTMTASWGSFGILWHKPIVSIFIRPHRYTFEFVENNPSFTLAFFPDTYKHILNYCGQNSGRKVDKIAETGLEPFELPSGSIGFEQARMIIECKKLYAGDLKGEHFIEKEIIHREYPSKDYHRMYIAEIVKCYVKV